MGCKCNGRLGNTGNPSCPMLMDIAGRYIFMHRYDGTGAENYIDMSVPIDADFITARLNDPDPTKRWYPSPGELENVSDERADSVFQTFESGNKAFIHKGARSVTSFIPNIGPRTYDVFEEYKCVQLAAFPVDLDGNLIGSRRDGDGSNKLYPIIIAQGSFDPKLVKKKNDTVQGMMLMFDWSKLEKDGDLYMIRESEIDGNLLTINGLFDVLGTVSGISTTGLTLALETIYGDPVTGLLAADFYDEVGGVASKIFNTTTSAAVSITSVTESPEGTYTFAFSAQTSADVLRVTPVKTKYDFAEIPEIVITVP